MYRLLFAFIFVLLSITTGVAQSTTELLFRIASDTRLLTNFSPDESYILTWTQGDTEILTLWNARTGDMLWSADTTLSTVTWNADSTRFITDSDAEGIAKLWSLDGEIVSTIDCELPIQNVVWYSENLFYISAWVNARREAVVCSTREGFLGRFVHDEIIGDLDWYFAEARLHTQSVTVESDQFVWLLTDDDVLIDTLDDNDTISMGVYGSNILNIR